MRRHNPILLRSDAEALRYGTMVADAYLAAPVFDESQAWRWKLLIDHVERLFERIQRGKQGVKVVYVEGQPYADERELQKGVEETGILYVSTDFNTHPIFTPEQNLKFRAVHDYMTHIARDVTFGLRGEIAAYNTHAKMVPPDAVPALFTEVLGQASTFIAKGFFPEQKIAVLPFDYYNIGIEMDSSRRRRNPAELLLLNPEEHTVRKPAKVQSVIIPKDRFTKRQAQAWIAQHGFIDPGVDETDDYYRFRQMDPDRQHFKYRTIPFGDSGVQAVVQVSRLPPERENPGVRIPKGMRPVIEAYSEQIAKLASRVIHEVTGEPLTVQWTPRTEPLGAGSWGVVYPTTDPRFVVKVTADPTEGPIVATIMSEPQLHNHMGIIHYFALRQLPEDITFRGKTFPVFVIVAERLKDVGGLRGWSKSREDEHLTRLLVKIKDVAGKLVHEKQKKRPSQRLIDMLDEQYLDLVGQIHDGPISDFFFQFRDATDDGVLADVHLNNVGKRAVDWEAVTNGVVPLSGADWHWVISDPGHSSVEQHPEIAPLRENPRRRP